ncbi:RNA polymerase II subunit A C-terminal domain phosphatase Fcp1 [Arctopsyche grandis]|uniref:RNA polymerase II subunit A C-terminal domain phosphatase Fcp1 n=1 Tax=Arctopsyche grandis TaxID=121162 RepID=UPI00406D8282
MSSAGAVAVAVTVAAAGAGAEGRGKGVGAGAELRGVVCPSKGECELARWRVKLGAPVRTGQVVAECRVLPPAPPAPAPPVAAPLRVRALAAGCVARLCVSEGDRLQPGQVILEIEECTHPTAMKDMCADCGTDLSRDDIAPTNIASIPMVHSVPELKVNAELAQELGKKDSEILLRDRKLVLLVDLDQTLIHTTNDHVPPNLKDVHHFQLRSWCPGGGGRWYHTRLRPGTIKFLKSISATYELHICTFGARAYAHKVAELLDPHGQLFSHRILSRDECFDIHTKTPNLRALFPCGDNLVCIIDDREDVWNRASNLIQVKPYHFFEHTGDINAPPGLGKTERDVEGQGVHLKDLKLKKKANSEVEQSAKAEELPALDASGLETKPDSTQNEKDAAESPKEEVMEVESTLKVESQVENVQSNEIKLDSDSVEIIPEKAIVKDIEKVVTQVTENFINADSTISEKKSEPDPLSKVKDPADKVSNIECDSTTPVSNSEEGTKNASTQWKITDDGMIDVEDSDDYLLYLEEVLQRIHKSFYEMYDSMEAGLVPDLKTVIPEVKSKVLAGTSLVFSGLVPTHQKLEHSRAYMVAQSLGAEVTQDFTERTTHLVAVRPGTAKVHACRKASSSTERPSPHTVTPAWLWCCAERWQHVEETLFPLRGGARYPRRPPPHCGSPPRIPHHPTTTSRRRTPSGRFMDTINPLLSFSSDDIADMDKEVEDIINESDESESDDAIVSKNGNAGEERLPETVPDDNLKENNLSDDLGNISSSSESIESLSGGDHPRGWNPEENRKRRRSSSPLTIEDSTNSVSPPKQPKEIDSLQITESDAMEESTCEEYPSEKFRRGGDLPSDGPDHNDSDTNGSAEAPDDIDDGEWNMMGAALEREFLGLDK